MRTRAFISRNRPRRDSLIPAPGRAARAFTLIELILVMAVLTVVISLTAPSLANFFRGRSLDSEARRLLALARQGQSRAVAEGIPMDLWLDVKQSLIGLEAEASYEPEDPRAVEFLVDPNLQIDLVNAGGNTGAGLQNTRRLSNGNLAQTRHSALPHIRFLPDGTFAPESPQAIVLTGRDGYSMSLSQTQNGLSYAIGTSRN